MPLYDTLSMSLSNLSGFSNFSPANSLKLQGRWMVIWDIEQEVHPQGIKECEKYPLKKILSKFSSKIVLPHAKEHTIDTITAAHQKLLQWGK